MNRLNKALRSRPSLEALEDRLPLAVDAFISPNDGKLYINGDNSSNSVEVRTQGYDGNHYDVYVEGHYYRTFPVYKVWGGELVFAGNGGYDTFVNNTGTRCVAHGGSGGDRLIGGRAGDLLIGGPGYDSLHGGDGDDELLAGEYGGVSADYEPNVLEGGNGGDKLYGDLGSDYMYGGFQYGWRDDGATNVLRGGGGGDLLVGGYGMDLLYGEGGNDMLDGRDDGFADYLNGGAGANSFQTEDYWFSWNGYRFRSNRDSPNDYSSAAGDGFYDTTYGWYGYS